MNSYNGCDKEEKRGEEVDGDHPAFTLKDKIVFTLLAIAVLGLGLYGCLTLHG